MRRRVILGVRNRFGMVFGSRAKVHKRRLVERFDQGTNLVLFPAQEFHLWTVPPHGSRRREETERTATQEIPPPCVGGFGSGVQSANFGWEKSLPDYHSSLLPEIRCQKGNSRALGSDYPLWLRGSPAGRSGFCFLRRGCGGRGLCCFLKPGAQDVSFRNIPINPSVRMVRVRNPHKSELSLWKSDG